MGLHHPRSFSLPAPTTLPRPPPPPPHPWQLVVDDRGCPEAYEVNYITYYPWNGHYAIPAGLPLVRTGHHVGGRGRGQVG